MAVPRVAVAISGTKAQTSPVNRQSGSNEGNVKHFQSKTVMDGTNLDFTYWSKVSRHGQRCNFGILGKKEG
eukprot:scaffold135693_cov29-Attheya_sp.AAC.2